jgi:hypothetical protein
MANLAWSLKALDLTSPDLHDLWVVIDRLVLKLAPSFTLDELISLVVTFREREPQRASRMRVVEAIEKRTLQLKPLAKENPLGPDRHNEMVGIIIDFISKIYQAEMGA